MISYEPFWNTLKLKNIETLELGEYKEKLKDKVNKSFK